MREAESIRNAIYVFCVNCRLQSLVIPQDLNLFSLHAVVPVLHCVVNTIAQPELFHSTMCLLREVSETKCLCSGMSNLYLILNT